jgi:hypothetical protein
MKKNTLIIILFLPFIMVGQVNFSFSSKSVSGTDLGLVDMNNDQLDDLIGISTSNIQIHFQQPDGTFNIVNHPISATYPPSWSMAVGDYDANGYNDFIWGSGSGAHVLQANSDGTAWSVVATSTDVFTQRTNFVDINNDGHLDAFICDDIDPNEYFMNDGFGNLTLYEGAQYATANGGDCTNPDDPISIDQVGVPGGLGIHPRGGNYGSIWVNYDGDRDMDLFIAKCGDCEVRRTNELYRNNGDGTFTRIDDIANLDDPINTWSSAWGDYDNDGDMDCFIGSSTGSEQHKLMRNDNGVFVDVSVASGVQACQNFYHESVFVDFDNDGFLDIYVNGDILYNDGDGTFTVEAQASTGLSGFGGALGDLNDDGFIDLFRNGIYENDGNSNNYLKVCLEGTNSNKNGIGATIELTTAAGTQIREVRSGEGFKYMNSLTAHFGIGTETEEDIISLIIRWPSGTDDLILSPTENQTLCVTEGETLSLGQSLVEDLILYPNPTKGILNINATYGFENARYTVFDMNGRQIMNSKFESNSIDVSNINSGMYFLRITDSGKSRTQKFIKN